MLGSGEQDVEALNRAEPRPQTCGHERQPVDRRRASDEPRDCSRRWPGHERWLHSSSLSRILPPRNAADPFVAAKSGIVTDFAAGGFAPPLPGCEVRVNAWRAGVARSTKHRSHAPRCQRCRKAIQASQRLDFAANAPRRIELRSPAAILALSRASRKRSSRPGRPARLEPARDPLVRSQVRRAGTKKRRSQIAAPASQCARQDSNLRPHAPEACALSN
jgi:hypothetical protein